MKAFIKKLQNLPEVYKKIIFFVIMGLAALGAGFFFMQQAKNNMSKIGTSISSINLPRIELPEMPKELEQAPAGAIKDETADWKTYANAEHGFEIKYPSEYSAKEYVKLIGVDFNSSIGLYSPKTDFTIKEWIDTKRARETSSEVSQAQINNYTVWQFMVQAPDMITYHTVFSSQQNIIVDVYYGATIQGDYQNIYNNMLSTFKFN